MLDTEDLLELIEECTELRFTNDMRRCDGEQGRGWYLKTNYLYVKNDRRIESPWPGFDTAQEAVEDLIDKINAVSTTRKKKTKKI